MKELNEHQQRQLAEVRVLRKQTHALLHAYQSANRNPGWTGFSHEIKSLESVASLIDTRLATLLLSAED